MKRAHLLFFCLLSPLKADIIADGTALFPVVVQIFENNHPTPVFGISVRLEGLPPYHTNEIDPANQPKAISDTLGKAVSTDATGTAVLFYEGRWGSTTSQTESIYSRSPLQGTLVISRGSKDLKRIDLEKWQKDEKVGLGSNNAAWIVISIDSEAEPAKPEKPKPTTPATEKK